jgi:hypothetical protein
MSAFQKKLTWHHQAQGTGSIPSQGFPFGHCALFQERPEEQNQSTQDFFLVTKFCSVALQ